MSSKLPVEIIVPPQESGMRLDRWLNQHLPNYSRSQIRRWIVAGQVKVKDSPVKPSYLVRPGDKIFYSVPDISPSKIEPERMPLEILYEDECLVVLNKPAPWVVHPGAGREKGTLVNALLYHCRDLSGIGGVLRPGIVHRLDKGTSGVMVVAKNDQAHRRLSDQFKDRLVEKKYLAFVWGTPRSLKGRIDRPLGRSKHDRKKIGSKTHKGREAVTEYQVLKSWGKISLLELTPRTGRTHQIRVHLSEMGHPIIGDPVYGKGIRKIASLPEPLQELVKRFPYQLLHAASLAFLHPTQERLSRFTVPMRKEMLDFGQILTKIFELS